MTINFQNSEKDINLNFEKTFLDRTLQQQIELCENNEYTSIFRRLLPDYQPILEAGCGSGRWVGWFAKNNWKATGIDWSVKLIERAKKEIPEAEFFTADIRNTSFKNGAFNSIVSLGAVEHSIDGPVNGLKEHKRVLSDRGIMILSIPVGNQIRKILYPLNSALIRLKGNNMIRRLFNKPIRIGLSYGDILNKTNRQWMPQIFIMNNEWQFYEFRFTPEQINGFLYSLGFEVLEEHYLFPEQGLLHTFGRSIGKFDYDRAIVKLNYFGRFLLMLFSKKAISHHICLIAKRKK